MSDFKTAVQITLQHEGGYVNNPNDSGHATNMGITQQDMPRKNMHELTVEEAIAYYQEHYWKPLYSQIVDQFVVNKLFDMGVLFGVNTAARLLQTVLDIEADGVFCFDTLAAVNTAEPVSLLSAYKTALVSHVVGICQAKPQDRVFFAGWIRRVNS